MKRNKLFLLMVAGALLFTANIGSNNNRESVNDGLEGLTTDFVNEEALIEKVNIKNLESESETLKASKMFVQHGNDGTYDYMRYAVALKGNINSISFTRSAPTYASNGEVVEATEEINTVYRGISANNSTYYFNELEKDSETQGLTTDSAYINDYYWACYSIRFSSKSFRESPVTVSINVNDGEFTTDRSMTLTNLKYNITNEFFAIDDNVVVGGFGNKNKKENCVGSTSKGLVSIEFPLHSSVAQDVKLYAAVSASGTTETTLNFDDHYDFYVNDDLKEVEAAMPKGTLFKDYDSIDLGTYSLRKGTNNIKFTIDKSLSGVQAFNLRSLKLVADNEVIYAETECSSKCSLCEGCQDESCEHDVCLTKCDCVKTEFKAIDDNTIVGGLGSKNTKEDCVGSTSKGLVSIEFPVYLGRSGNYGISVIMSCASSIKNFADNYNFYINDELQTTDAKTPQGTQFTEYAEVILGVYNFTSRTNVIKFTIDKSLTGVTAFNFRSLILTGSTSTWAELECSSKCEICGGCLDASCEGDVCLTKCSCIKSTFSVLDEKVVTEGKDKDNNNECIGVSSKAVVNITYTINSKIATKVQLSITMSRWTSNRNIIRSSSTDTAAHAYSLYINDVEQFSDAKTIITSNSSDANAKFYEFDEIVLGTYDLVAGNNTILLSADYSTMGKINVNFRSFGLLTTSNADISLV